MNSKGKLTGIKYSKDPRKKPDFSLLPWKALWEVAKVFSVAAAPKSDGTPPKYDRFNYRGGILTHETWAAAMRHLIEWNEGEDFDSEDDLHKLAHATCEILMCLQNCLEKPECDDRYRGNQ